MEQGDRLTGTDEPVLFYDMNDAQSVCRERGRTGQRAVNKLNRFSLHSNEKIVLPLWQVNIIELLSEYCSAGGGLLVCVIFLYTKRVGGSGRTNLCLP